MRLVYSKNELVMRLRDNCPMFDIKRFIAQEIAAARDDGKPHIGLKIIGSMADNIKYVYSMENNNVILRFGDDELKDASGGKHKIHWKRRFRP